MNSLHKLSLETAETLEKTAAYLDALEGTTIEAKAREVEEKFVNPVAEKLAEILGSEVDGTIKEKLSSADPEILGLINKIAANAKAEEDAETWGDADEPTKVASDDEDPILAFINS